MILEPINDADICNVNLTPSDIQQLKYDIDEGYIYELVIDHITLKLPFGYHQNEAYVHIGTCCIFYMIFVDIMYLQKFIFVWFSITEPFYQKALFRLKIR
jgi:hypothetical protein